MKTVVSIVPVPSVITRGNGTTTSSPKAQDVQSTHVAWQTVNGDFEKPYAFRFWRVMSSGLRGRCLRLQTTIGPNSYVSEVGGFASSFDTDGSSFATQTQLDGLYAAARQSALDKLTTRVRGDLDVSIDLLTLGQTRNMVEQLYKNTVQFRDTVERLVKRLKGSSTLRKEIGQAWLIYNFGVMPTIGTLYGLFEKFNKEASTAKPWIHCRGRGSRTDAVSKKVGVTAFSYKSADVNTQVNMSVRCSFDLRLSPTSNALQKIGEYTSLNPASMVWELTRFSFLFDYFVNVGGYLRNLETAMVYGSKFLDGTETRTELVHAHVVNGTASWGTASDGLSWDGMNGSHQHKLYDRLVLGSYPLPRLPVMEPQLGWRRIASILALLAQVQALSGKRRPTAAERRKAREYRRIDSQSFWETETV